MSDFDKEAEREKLREKYGDEEDRQATRQMSELLLQGATMTNSHCEDCGDPIFRYEGQEFCPTCQAEGTAGQQSADGASQPADGRPADEADRGESSAASARDRPADRPDAALADPEDATDGDGPGATADGTAAGDAPDLDHPTTVPGDAADRGPGTPPDRATVPDRDPAAVDGAPGTAPEPGADRGAGSDLAGTGDLAGARESVERTLTRFAHAADGEDRPDRAREHLAVVREAAQTLRELESLSGR
jgi:uncharacterized Zn finger protein (UPF0148 family)